jgi:hypothetical protein
MSWLTPKEQELNSVSCCDNFLFSDGEHFAVGSLDDLKEGKLVWKCEEEEMLCDSMGMHEYKPAYCIKLSKILTPTCCVPPCKRCTCVMETGKECPCDSCWS